jgi:NADH:ubiquinone oxidoreductase subunit 6 (subunit J)
MAGGTRRRIVVAGGTLLLLLGALGLASRAHTPAGGGGTRTIDTDLLLEYMLLAAAALAIVVAPVAIWMFVAGRDEQESSAPAQRNWMSGALIGMVGLALVAVVLMRTDFFKHRHSGHGSTAPAVEPAGRTTAAPREIRFDWVPVIVVSSLTAAGLAAAAFTFVRRREPAAPPDAAAVLVLAIERTLDDLRAEADPRRAVIAAYAQMEGALGRAGLPRRPAEAPREYLQRVLPEVGAGAESVERLTSLFEQAKFSPHAIDAAMKEEAIAALEHLRDELRSAG